MAFANFDEIFGPGEFDDDENTYEREFPGVEVGRTRSVLDFDTLWEHANRRGYDVTPYPNGGSKDLEIQNGNIDVFVENFPDGRTALSLDFDESIRSVEAYMRGSGGNGSVDQWLGELIRREQKAYEAASRYVHSTMRQVAESEDLSPEEVLVRDLEDIGSAAGFHEAYREGSPNHLTNEWASEFELEHDQDSDMRRSDLPGRMPFADELDDESLRSRNDLFQRIYLESVLVEADDVYGLDEDVRSQWLEYVDVTYA